MQRVPDEGAPPPLRLAPRRHRGPLAARRPRHRLGLPLAHDADASLRGARRGARGHAPAAASRDRPHRHAGCRGRRRPAHAPPLHDAGARGRARRPAAHRDVRRQAQPRGADRPGELREAAWRGGCAARGRRVHRAHARALGRSRAHGRGGAGVLRLRHARRPPRGGPDPLQRARRRAGPDGDLHRGVGARRRPPLEPALRSPAAQQGGPAAHVDLGARAAQRPVGRAPRRRGAHHDQARRST